jgi:hemin uptake protein HemP
MPAGPSQRVVHRVQSRELLHGTREIVIVHGDQEYRLRHTQNDKLILTK